MNIPIVLMVIGVFLLLMGQTAWAGLGMIAIGLIAYLFTSRQPDYNPYFDQAFRKRIAQKQQQAGFDWSVKDDMNPAQTRRDGPKIDGDMFSLPLPMGELTDMLDIRHKTKVK
ncbi:MAG: hypothetical protein JXB14_05530 [Candidatus Altiarchaeota archaeon]|nr:hypothetical protein [Candidatus Altiarchaeota archaeon]